MTLSDVPVNVYTKGLDSPPMASRILLLTASVGEGHNAAAHGLQMALEERSHLSLGHCAETRLVDLCTEVYPRLTRFARWGYLKAIHHAPRLWERVFNHFDGNQLLEKQLRVFSSVKSRLQKEIETFKPDAVVCTFPFYNQIIDSLYQDKNPPFLRITVVTDSICINSIWAKGRSDFFIVPNRPTLDALKQHGVPVANILDLGFPVSLKFANCQIERGNPPPWHVIYLPGGPWNKIQENLHVLTSLPKIELTLVAGKDRKLQAMLKQEIKRRGLQVEVLGWINDMPERLLGQHLFIGKAGGALVQECIAAGCPLIISQVIPGQEVGNVALIKQQGVGAVAETSQELKTLMIRMMQGEAALWRSWKGNLLMLQRPLAAQTIARFVLGRIAIKK
jgi:processive 1,2-diacylglycerol beta-glucosyltransferase